MNRTRLAIAGLLIGAFAAVALGQNADKNSAGPTKNDYRLKVMEPAEGATITGPTVRVIVNTMVQEQLGSEKRDVNSMPRPDVDVFLDDTLKGTMRDENNVLEIESVPAGTHKIVLLAKNKANEIIDRKEVHFSSVAGEAAATTTTNPADATRSTASTAPAPPEPAPAPPPPPAPAPAPMTHDSASASTYSSPSTSPRGSSADQPVRISGSQRNLPATASLDPALVVAGAGLLLASLLIRRLLARRRRFVA
jgi:hypothetical protein